MQKPFNSKCVTVSVAPGTGRAVKCFCICSSTAIHDHFEHRRLWTNVVTARSQMDEQVTCTYWSLPSVDTVHQSVTLQEQEHQHSTGDDVMNINPETETQNYVEVLDKAHDDEEDVVVVLDEDDVEVVVEVDGSAAGGPDEEVLCLDPGRSKRDTLRCGICHYIALSKDALASHFRAHRTPRKFYCHHCEYSALHLSSMEKHQAEKHKRRGVSETKL